MRMATKNRGWLFYASVERLVTVSPFSRRVQPLTDREKIEVLKFQLKGWACRETSFLVGARTRSPFFEHDNKKRVIYYCRQL